ncbi:MAG: trigger factor [Candidatus Paceibacterota bacterium]
MADQKNYQNVTVNEQDNAQVEIEGEITAEKLTEARKRALDKLRASAQVEGFRSGNAPDDVLINKYGEMTILQEAAELSLSDEYPVILRDHSIQAIGQPQISITKLAPNEALGFKITTATMPEVKVPDYKKVAKETLEKEENQPQDIEVTEKEVEDTILQVRRNVAQQKQQESGIETTGGDDSLPDLTDEFVSSLGDFKDVEDFKTKIKDNIKEQKRREQTEKRRLAVVEALIEESTITLPPIIIDSEVDKLVQQLKSDVSRAGMSFEDYLKQTGKNEDDIRTEWRPQAEKKAKTQLILNKITTEEKLTPDQDLVNQHVEKLISQHPNANREQAKVFVETQLLNDQVLRFLEEQAPAQKSDAKEDKAGDEKKEEKEKASDDTKKDSKKDGKKKKEEKKTKK